MVETAKRAFNGKNVLLFVGRTKDEPTATGQAGLALLEGAHLTSFQTEHSITRGVDAETLKTKDQPDELSLSDVDYEISQTIYASNQKLIKELKNDQKAKRPVFVWAVYLDDVSAEASEEYYADFFVCYITQWDDSAPNDGKVEISATYKPIGQADGYTPLPTALKDLVTKIEFLKMQQNQPGVE